MAEEPTGSTTGDGAGKKAPASKTPASKAPASKTTGKKATAKRTTTSKAAKAPAAKTTSRAAKRVPAPSVEQGPVETTAPAEPRTAPAGSQTAPAARTPGTRTRARAGTRARKTVPAPSVEQGPVETPSAPPAATSERAQTAATGMLMWPFEAVHVAAVTAEKSVQLAGLPVAAARAVLDRKGGLPAYLSAGALAVVGVIEWPAAVGASAGYAALRRWGDRLPEPLRTLTGSGHVEPPPRTWDEG